MATHKLTLHREGKNDIELKVNVIEVTGPNAAADSEKRDREAAGHPWPPIDSFVVYDIKTLRSYLVDMFESGYPVNQAVALDADFIKLCRLTGNPAGTAAFTINLDTLVTPDV
jgi:hypothetical protein